jgi:hypothetical protein
MKIAEIIVEGAFSQGQNAVNKVLHPLQAIQGNASFQKGYNAVAHPLRSLAGALGSTKFKNDQKDKTKTKPQEIQPVELKRSADRVASGQKLFSDDLSNLKQMYHAVNRNTIRIPTGIDKKELLNSIRTAYNNQQLNDKQQSILSQFAKSL